MIDHIQQRRKAAVMVESTFLVGPEAVQGGSGSADRGPASAWKSSIRISSAVCRFQPGSLADGLDMAARTRGLASKEMPSPRAAASASKLPGGGLGAGIAS